MPNKQIQNRRSGQALLMVTLGLFAMCGLMGLAVDLGWCFFVKKSAQAAADSAALAAVSTAKRLPIAPKCGNGTNQYNCVSGPTSCGAGGLTGNLTSACIYASLNGFPQGGKVNVTVDAGDSDRQPPTVPNVKVLYWVTVRVNQQIPQLFSAVLGNSTAMVSARATAAVTNVATRGQMILLNRHNDHVGIDSDANTEGNLPAGTDLYLGSGTLSVPAGIRLASSLNPGAAIVGNGSITNSPTYVQGGGTLTTSGSGNWNPPPVSKGDGPMFFDPMAGKGQPPLVTNSLPDVQVPNGILQPGDHTPGNYYATAPCSTGQCATGQPITLAGGDHNFTNSDFGEYIFYGGLVSNGANMTLAPGEYVFAGTTSANGSVLNLSGSGSVSESSPSGGAGEIFIFTNLTYPRLPVPPAVTDYQNNPQNPPFQYGNVDVELTGGTVSMHGLDGNNLPPSAQGLQGFAPVAFWQDQADSHVAYDTLGNVVVNTNQQILGCPDNANNLANPCGNSNVSPASKSAGMTINQSGNSIKGAIYQPRGGWIKLTGTGGIASYQLISGAIDLQLTAGSTLTLNGMSSTVTSLQTVLVE